MKPLPSYSQAAENNKFPIGQVLTQAFANCRHVLEIAGGTGQHAVHMGRLLPHLIWQSSDLAGNLDDLAARIKLEAGANVPAPIALDAGQVPWPVSQIDGVFAANAVHIMSWKHVTGLFAGLEQALMPGGILALYGPYKYDGEFTTSSNAEFDNWLRARDPLSGIRDFEVVNELAENIGLVPLADHPMPANNQLLVWQRG